MAIPLVDITVRPTWQEITEQLAEQRNRLWRAAEVAIAAVTLVLISAELLFPTWPWHNALHILLLTGVVWLFPLWTIYRANHSLNATVLRLLAASLLLLVVTAIAYATIPRITGGPSWLATLPILAVPAITWSFLYTLHRRYPIPVRMLGLTAERWPVNLTIGATAGVVLGLHLALTTSFLPEARPSLTPTPALLLWALFFRAGLTALGEEMFFRGMGYRLLYDGTPRSLTAAIAKLTLLNLPVYFVFVLEMPPDAVSAALLLVYGIAFAAVAAFLRHRQQSLLPSLVCNIVFSLFVIAFLIS